jgi:hypothetical protein
VPVTVGQPGARLEARIRPFDDGAAVFDPVTWQTHVLSHEGLALLRELMQMAAERPAEPAQSLIRRLLADSPDSSPTAELMVCAEIACHLSAGKAEVTGEADVL